jgi:hypothetical protein
MWVGNRSVAVSVALLALAAAFGCDVGESCTEIGCMDGWSLTVREADGSVPAHTVELDIDGAHIACPAVSLDARFATCADLVTIQLVDEVVCEERTSSNGDRSQVCTPTGRFEQMVSVNATPTEVVVMLREGDTVTDERSFEPRYETTQPNGPDCGPTCHQASDQWDLP